MAWRAVRCAAKRGSALTHARCVCRFACQWRHSCLELQADFSLAHVSLAKGCCAAVSLRTAVLSRARNRVPFAALRLCHSTPPTSSTSFLLPHRRLFFSPLEGGCLPLCLRFALVSLGAALYVCRLGLLLVCCMAVTCMM